MTIVFTLALAASLAAQDLDRKVSAEVRAADAPTAIAELSRQIGIPLEAMQSMKRDFLVIRVSNVPASELMKRIASTLHAGWEKTSTGYRLLRTEAMKREEAAKEFAARVAAVQKSIDKLAAQRKEDGSINQQQADLTAERLYNQYDARTGGPLTGTSWATIQKLQAGAPGNRLLSQVLLQFRAEDLVTPKDTRIVYSTNPTRMQRRMPANLQPLIQAFVKEQAIWAKALQRARSRRGNVGFYLDNATDPTDRKIGKVLLSVSSLTDNNIHVNLIISDDRGRQLGRAFEMLTGDYRAYSESLKLAEEAGKSEESMQFKGLSAEVADKFAEWTQRRDSQGMPLKFTISRELREALLHPEKHEPLSLMATDTLFEIGRIKGLNLIANPPDELAMGYFYRPQSMKPTAFLTLMNGIGLITVSIDNGWLNLAPTWSSYARADRTDRSALNAYLNTGAKEGRLSLDNRARFAFNSGRTREESISVFYAVFLGLIPEGNEYGGNWNALRLLGSMNARQRQQAKISEPISFRTLTPAQIRIIDHLVFQQPYANIEVSYQPEDFANGEDEVIWGRLEQEPTEALPNGFTGQEELNANDVFEPKFFGRPDMVDGMNNYWGEGTYDENSLANELFQKERPEFFPWRNDRNFAQPHVTKFRIGNERRVTFRIEFNRRASLSMSLNDRFYNSEAMPIDKFPADLKKRIETILAQIREAYKNQKVPDWNPGGGAAPPPPPPN